jgi:hypothetical protein
MSHPFLQKEKKEKIMIMIMIINKKRTQTPSFLKNHVEIIK